MTLKQKAVSIGASAALLGSLLASTVAGTAFAAVTMSPTTGPVGGGTLVSITGGSSFNINTTITLTNPITGACGSVAATSVSPDGSSLTFLTPDCTATGVGLYTVTTSANTVGLPGFFYTNTPGPVTLTPATGKDKTVVTLSAPGQNIPSGTPAPGTVTVGIAGSNPPATLPASFLRLSSTSLSLTIPVGACPVSAGSTNVPIVVPGIVGIPAFNCNPTTTYTMAPNSGSLSGGTVVQLSGDAQSFDLSCQVTMTTGAVVQTVFPTSVAADGSKLVFVTPAAPTAPATSAGTQADVKVTAPGVGSCTAGTAGKYTWTSATSGTGALQIVPTTGPTGGGTAVQVQNATSLTVNSTVVLSGTAAAVAPLCTLTPTSISADGKSLTFVMPSEASVTVAPLNAGCSGALTLTSHVIYVWTNTPGVTNPAQPVNSGSFTYGAVTVPVVTSVSPNSGPIGGGNSVTITGSNFQSGAKVAFGTVQSASVTFVSATSLTAVVPAGTGTVSVTVLNPDGNSGQLPSGYTYNNTSGYKCVTGTAIGVTSMNATYTTSTKVVAPGQYITYRFSCTNAAAGQLFTILGAQRNSAGVWGAWAPFTKRTADASGNFLFNIRTASPSWWSFRSFIATSPSNQNAGIYSNAVQSRWR